MSFMHDTNATVYLQLLC